MVRMVTLLESPSSLVGCSRPIVGLKRVFCMSLASASTKHPALFPVLDPPPTNASNAAQVGWDCSFDYVVNETTVDSFVAKFEADWGPSVRNVTLYLAVIALAVAVQLHRVNRRIANAYMAATEPSLRVRFQKEHDNMRKVIIRAAVAALISAGLHGSAALYGSTFQAFGAVDALFIPLLWTSFLASLIVFFVSSMMLL